MRRSSLLGQGSVDEMMLAEEGKEPAKLMNKGNTYEAVQLMIVGRWANSLGLKASYAASLSGEAGVMKAAFSSNLIVVINTR